MKEGEVQDVKETGDLTSGRDNQRHLPEKVSFKLTLQLIGEVIKPRSGKRQWTYVFGLRLHQNPKDSLWVPILFKGKLAQNLGSQWYLPYYLRLTLGGKDPVNTMVWGL